MDIRDKDDEAAGQEEKRKICTAKKLKSKTHTAVRVRGRFQLMCSKCDQDQSQGKASVQSKCFHPCCLHSGG